MILDKGLQYLRLIHNSRRILNAGHPGAIGPRVPGKSIIIVGGELRNKGAQAMTFAVVDEMRTRCPDHKIYLFSALDGRIPDSERGNYLFEIRAWPQEIKRQLICPSPGPVPADVSGLEEILVDAAVMIDINGYALSSQWGRGVSLDYLLNIVIAKKYAIPFVALPQSLGPFNYRFLDGMMLRPLLRRGLRYPFRIYVRERVGLDRVRQFTGDNIEYSPDLVFYKRSIDPAKIYAVPPVMKDIRLPPRAVVVVPNVQLQRQRDYSKVVALFQAAVSCLIERGVPVYLIRHSTEDRDLCRDIAAKFMNDQTVHWIDEELNIFELDALLRQAGFLITARYHSIVFAFRNAVPCVVVGWADKYDEMMENFEQQAYYMKLDASGDERRLVDCVQRMVRERDPASTVLTRRIAETVTANIFTSISEAVEHGKSDQASR